MTKVYGIANCDTIRKARRWLDEQKVDYQFHDYRKQGLDRTLLERLEAQAGWEALLNRRGTTWRKLPDSVRDNIGRLSAMDLMLEHPAIIKRPVLETDNVILVGFDPKQWSAQLS